MRRRQATVSFVPKRRIGSWCGGIIIRFDQTRSQREIMKNSDKALRRRIEMEARVRVTI